MLAAKDRWLSECAFLLLQCLYSLLVYFCKHIFSFTRKKYISQSKKENEHELAQGAKAYAACRRATTKSESIRIRCK
jgi:hypothetical protein